MSWVMRHLIGSLALSLVVSACASTPAPAPAAPAPASAAAFPVDDVDAVKAKLAAGAVLVDVRPVAIAAKAPVQATNIPFDEAEARVAEFEALLGGDKSKPIVVACGHGGMAIEVKKMLLSKGFTDVSAQAIGNVGTPTASATPAP